jgi:hypothetical protein
MTASQALWMPMKSSNTTRAPNTNNDDTGCDESVHPAMNRALYARIVFIPAVH